MSALNSTPLGRMLLTPHSDFFVRHLLLDSQDIVNSILATLAITLFFGVLILITRGRGMGGGDLKLGIFMGFSLGFPNAFLALVLAFLSGSLVGILLLILKIKKFGQTIPFGPFLSLGSLTALIWGEQIINWYFKYRVF